MRMLKGRRKKKNWKEGDLEARVDDIAIFSCLCTPILHPRPPSPAASKAQVASPSQKVSRLGFHKLAFQSYPPSLHIGNTLPVVKPPSSQPGPAAWGNSDLSKGISCCQRGVGQEREGTGKPASGSCPALRT